MSLSHIEPESPTPPEQQSPTGRNYALFPIGDTRESHIRACLNLFRAIKGRDATAEEVADMESAFVTSTESTNPKTAS